MREVTDRLIDRINELQRRVDKLERRGGYRLFNVAGTTKTIASGVITKEAGKITWHVVDGQTGLSDDLDTISGGAAGDILFLTMGNMPIVLKDGTGNLLLTGDLTLGNVADLAVLFYRGSNWYEISFSNIA